jgi:hypothetical protein
LGVCEHAKDPGQPARWVRCACGSDDRRVNWRDQVTPDWLAIDTRSVVVENRRRANGNSTRQHHRGNRDRQRPESIPLATTRLAQLLFPIVTSNFIEASPELGQTGR